MFRHQTLRRVRSPDTRADGRRKYWLPGQRGSRFEWLESRLPLAEVDLQIQLLVDGQSVPSDPGPFLAPNSKVEILFNVGQIGQGALAGVEVAASPSSLAIEPVLGADGLNAGDRIRPNGLLDSDETWQFKAVSTVDLGWFVFEGEVTAIDVGCEFNCAVSDSATGRYFGYLAGITLDVRLRITDTNTVQAEDPERPHYVLAGQNLTWEYEIRPTAGTNVTQRLDLVDSLGSAAELLSGDTGNNPGVLDPDETWVYQVTEIAPSNWRRNQVSVDATGVAIDEERILLRDTQGEVVLVRDFSQSPNGLIVQRSALDASHSFGYVVSVDIEHTINGQDADSAPGPEVLVPSLLVWTYVVRAVPEGVEQNNLPQQITVTTDPAVDLELRSGDDVHAGDANGNGLLDVDESWLYRATAPARLHQRDCTSATAPARLGPQRSSASVTAIPIQLLLFWDGTEIQLSDDSAVGDSPINPDEAGQEVRRSDRDLAYYFGAMPSIVVSKEISVDGGETWLAGDSATRPLWSRTVRDLSFAIPSGTRGTWLWMWLCLTASSKHCWRQIQCRNLACWQPTTQCREGTTSSFTG